MKGDRWIVVCLRWDVLMFDGVVILSVFLINYHSPTTIDQISIYPPRLEFSVRVFRRGSPLIILHPF